MEKFRTSVTIETNEIWVVRQPRVLVRARCEMCGRETSFLPPNEAARIVCRDLSAIYALMAANRFHVQSFESGKSFICLNSLCFM